MREVELKVKIPERLERRMERFGWVDWSKVAAKSFSERLEDIEEIELVAKKDGISKKYRQGEKLSREEEKFCERIDWHPVDELPMKKEFVEELKKVKRGPHSRSMTIEEFRNWCDKL